MNKTAFLIILLIVSSLAAGCQTIEDESPVSPTHSPLSPTATLTSAPPTATEIPVPPTLTAIVKPPDPTQTSEILADVLPSGQIAFYSERDGNAEIYTMNPDGSNQQRLTDNPFEDSAPVWSPDGSQIAFISDRDDPHPVACFPECFYQIYILNGDGSNEHRLVETELNTLHPDWHPDGTRLSFDTGSSLDGDIYSVNADGSNLQLLIEDGLWASWSPDGRQIVFSSNRDGDFDIFIMNIETNEVRKVVDTGLNDYFPEWSPDGLQIVFFAANWPTVRQDIYTVNVDGSKLQNITNTPQVVDEDPQWSPDGSKIVFQTDRDGNFEIYFMNPDGSQPQNLTRDLRQDYYPSWGQATMPKSADSSPKEIDNLIAFVSTRDGNGEIYVMNTDGSEPRRLTNYRQWDGYPTWSPKGKQIAYYSYLGDQDWVIKIMDSDGSNQHQLTDNHTCDGAPRWSPDGVWIVYSADPDCSAEHREIVLIEVDGSNPMSLTQNQADDMGASWSPDGQQIVFSSDRDGDYEIYIMDLDGNNLRQLTFNEAQDYMPDWSPDGTQIAFVSNLDGNDEIYVMDLDGDNVIRMTQTQRLIGFLSGLQTV